MCQKGRRFLTIKIIEYEIGEKLSKTSVPFDNFIKLMLEEKVLNTIKKYELIENGNTIVIGVSGGPDSMALLNVLISLKKEKKIECKIVVAHINHGIRIEADEETQYVEDFCKKHEISCFIKREKVENLAKEQKIGTEEAGRKLRYSFFEEVATKVSASKIATAHNANDNVETILMNMIRGTGLTGLKGIEIKRENKYIRPLIECTRKEIEEYCTENKLEPKQDKSNKENIYTRNKIRNILLPLLEEEFNSNIVTSLNRMSQIVKEENEYIQKQVKKAYEEIMIQEFLGNSNFEEKNTIILDLKKFNNQDKVIKNRLVLYTINRLLGTSKDIEMIHIADIIKLCENNIGNKYLTPNKKVKVLVNKGKLFFQKINEC